MKNRLLFLLVVFCSLGLLVHPGCKTAEDAAQYVLTVTVGEGITGTPATGSYSYTDADLVNFSYSLQTGYENLVVQLDGVTVGNNGIIAMNMNHTLNVTADSIFDVSGEWNGTLTYGGTQYSIQYTFSGGFYYGTVSGDLETIAYGEGTYSITNGTIEFRVNFPSSYWHNYSGIIDDDNNMSGTWISSLSEEGPWELYRD